MTAAGGAGHTVLFMVRNASERGAGLVEYVLLLAFVAVVSITGIQFVGEATQEGLPQATAAVSGEAEEADASTTTSSTTSSTTTTVAPATTTTSTTEAPSTTTTTTEAPASGGPKCEKSPKNPKC